MKRTLCLLAAALLLVLPGLRTAGAEVILLPEEVLSNSWYQDENAKLAVGNPTPMRGRFFTTLWGGSTSDLDAQDLLYAFSPVLWDGELGRFRFDRSVTQDAVAMTDGDGNRVYLLSLAQDMLWSDGTPVTAGDYAFSILLQMDPAIAETGGKPADFSWLAGSDEYLDGTAKTLSGVRLITDNLLQITMKADSLPNYYELNRLNVRPYPAGEIVPGAEVADDGDGVYLTRPLTADTLRETVLDEQTGYLSHPRVVSGPYLLESFSGTTAKFAINPLYKGDEAGMVPRIGKLEYTWADNSDMISRLKDGEFDLLDKVTEAGAIRQGLDLLQNNPGSFTMDYEMRTGLTLLWFLETSQIVQDKAVRQAVACCFDRDGFIREYTDIYGVRRDGFYGLDHWPFLNEAGAAEQAGDGPVPKARDSLAQEVLTLYHTDTDEAVRLLETAGWTLNEAGEPFDSTKDRVRYKRTGNDLTGLKLTLEMPENGKARTALETHLAEPLRKAGVELTLKQTDMESLQDAYEGRAESNADILYLGEDFTIAFDPEIFTPRTEGTELSAVKKEIRELALEMIRTEPEDTAGFAAKWAVMQKKITEELPLLPVYSNVYFDFFTRKLHDYRITDFVTWGQAIVSSYMSDMEELNEEETQEREAELETWNRETDD